jgi:hypothetical protein
MEKMQPLLDTFLLPEYKTRYRSAKSTHTCLMCGNPARGFRDEWAKLRYEISALCQECQDRYFEGD